MNKIQAIILRNEMDDDHILWTKACERYREEMDYRIVNLTKDDWFEKIHKQPFDILLSKPGGLTSIFKQLYDERIHILGDVLSYKIFPAPEEIFIYENKRILSYWLKANGIPHPVTHVFYDREEAEAFIKKTDFPVVAKTNIGASGSGVKMLDSKLSAKDYINQTFSLSGAPKRIGPNISKGDWMKRGFHYVLYPSDAGKKLKIYKSGRHDRQYAFVIFQEYIPHEFEWRVVRIGDSFFAHKKLKLDEKASGSYLKNYDNPPIMIFDFVKNITDKFGFYSQAVDIFESDRGYLVNEMQCIFGQSDPYQMKVDGKPGRYIFSDENWLFEEGDFARNSCYDLRIEFVLSKFHSLKQ